MWSLAPLGELASSFVDGPFGSNLKASEYVDVGIPLARIQNVRSNYFDPLTLKAISESKARELRRHDFCGGDLLITKLGEPAGVACVVPQNFGAGVVVADVTRFRGHANLVDHQYLSRFLNSPGGRAEVAKRAKGSTRQRINLSGLREIPVPLPPLGEQRRIAAILDQGDRLRRLRRGAIERLDALAQSTFEAILGDPVRNPKGWAEDRILADVADIGSGVTKGRKLNGKDTRLVPYLAVANVQDRRLSLSNIKMIEASEQEIERYRLQPDDLLLTEGGDPDKLGRGALWTGEIADAIHQNHIFRVRLRSSDVHPVFLNWLIGSRRGKQYFLRAAKQTTGIASINMGQLKKFPLLVPPADVQNRFAKAIHAIEQAKVEHSLHLRHLDALFTSLQHRAFLGEL